MGGVLSWMRGVNHENILGILREEPGRVFEYVSVYAHGEGWGGGAIGGRCTVEAVDLRGGVVGLIARPDPHGQDFYYPWVEAGMGRVELPHGTPEGTIVLTEGMQGCRQRILTNDDTGSTIFIHDHYGRYEAQDGETLKSTLVYDRDNLADGRDGDVATYAESHAAENLAMADNTGDIINNFFTSLITVQKAGCLEVYGSSVVQKTPINGMGMDLDNRRYVAAEEPESGCLMTVALIAPHPHMGADLAL